ncbi:MAG TPA: response regulator transcription factor [Aggregatilineales bacterium]|nr:response regulator transcription factor [Anaerolineales bacterium]HRE47476.1 response regulator transcription factor [Aggregatilineales bacterium]
MIPDRSLEVRLFIIAANPLARIGMGAMVERVGGVIVVGEASPDPDLADLIATHTPDALLWDADGGGIDLLPTLEGIPPTIALVADSNQAAEAWTVGVRGIITRSTPPERIVAALRAVVEGLAVFDPALAAALFPSTPHESPTTEGLTTREREVLTLIAEGLPNKTIAGRLGISENTVKFHVNAVMSKLGVQSRTEAVVKAVRLGWFAL